MANGFIKSALEQAAINNQLALDEQRTPQHFDFCIKAAAAFNGAFLATEKPRSLAPGPQVRRVIDTMFRYDIIHAVWTDASSVFGVGTMLIKGRGVFYDVHIKRQGYRGRRESAILVPDQEAARWIKKICGGFEVAFEWGDIPEPTGTPYLAICVDRPQPDGTIVRETIREAVEV